MIRLETQRGTAACTRRLVEGTEYCGQANTERKRAKEEERRECFVFDSWFGGVVAANQLKAIHEDEEGLPAGHESIAAVKTNHKLFPKKELELLMKEWPSGSCILLSCMQPNVVELFAIGYEYNMTKVFSFIFTKDAGSSAPGEPYIARFPSSSEMRRRERSRGRRSSPSTLTSAMWFTPTTSAGNFVCGSRSVG
jgi:hypothetical protein